MTHVTKAIVLVMFWNSVLRERGVNDDVVTSTGSASNSSPIGYLIDKGHK